MATSPVLVAPPPLATPFLDARGRITSPWFIWLTTVTNSSGTLQGVIDALRASTLQRASNLADLADIPTARGNLGLGSAALKDTSFFDLAGAAATAQGASLQKVSNLADLTNVSTARSNLGLGSAALQPASAFDTAGAAAAAQAAAIAASDPVGAATAARVAAQASSLQKTANLSDVASAATAITNLLGTYAPWSPTITGAGAMTISGVTVSAGAYLQFGPLCHLQFNISFTTGGTQSAFINLPLPVAPAGATISLSLAGYGSTGVGTWIPIIGLFSGSTLQAYAGGNTTTNYAVGAHIVSGSILYRI